MIKSSCLIIKSVIAKTGILRLNLSQFSPSLKEIYTPNSVPATNSPFLFSSSLTTLVYAPYGIFPVISFQDSP